MHFTREQLEKFAAWDSVVTGYDRDQPPQLAERLLTEMLDSKRFVGRVFEQGGLSNHTGVFLAYPSDLPDASQVSQLGRFSAIKVPGVTVYLSLLAPVGVFGRTISPIGPTTPFGYSYLNLTDIVDPDDAQGELETAILSAIAKTPYQILTREDVMQPLPPGITPYEYCFCDDDDGPWDKVFHALFCNSD